MKADQVDTTGVLPGADCHDWSFADHSVTQSSSAGYHTHTFCKVVQQHNLGDVSNSISHLRTDK